MDAAVANKRRKDAERQRKSKEKRNEMIVRFGTPPENPEAVEACRSDLLRFLRGYFSGRPDEDPRPWFFTEFSDAQLTLIRALESRILGTGLLCVLAPRGAGKSKITKASMLWALLYGHRKFVAYFGSTERKSTEHLEDVKYALCQNVRLREDFPDIGIPFWKVWGAPSRAHVLRDESTMEPVGLRMERERLVFPTVAGVMGGGGVFYGASLDSNVRGTGFMSYRPDFCVIDDPTVSTHSARNPEQQEKIRDTISGNIRFLQSGYGDMPIVMVATTMAKDDIADEYSDPQRQPGWDGLRIPFLRDVPEGWTKSEGVAEYIRLWREDRRGGDRRFRRAHAYYLANRASIDGSIRATLPLQYKGSLGEKRFSREDGTTEEVSAVQRVLNILSDPSLGERYFRAELQNDPPDGYAEGHWAPLRSRDILSSVVDVPRRVLPRGAQAFATAFFDVGKQTHVHAVLMGFGADLTGHIADYGVFEVKDPHGPGGIERAVSEALSSAWAWVLGSALTCENGASAPSPGRLLVDSGYQAETVYSWTETMARRHGDVAWASDGWSALSFTPKEKGSAGVLSSGERWYRSTTKTGSSARTLKYDADHWKSTVDARWRIGPGGKSSLTMFSGDHTLPGPLNLGSFVSQSISERRLSKKRRNGTRATVWRSKQEGRDNHFWDCVVGCYVAANTLGASLDTAMRSFGTGARIRYAASAPRRNVPFSPSSRRWWD